MSEMAKTNDVFGLVLAGGRSKRMGQDKSILNYHGRPQVQIAHDLLIPYCAKVFISNRPDQSHLPGHDHLPQLHDDPEFMDKGPIGGILSAMKLYPDHSWLILACDLPFVTREVIVQLIQQRDPRRFATAFKSAHDGLPEPLCAIWERGSLEAIQSRLKQGMICPRKILINSDTLVLTLTNTQALDNINTPEEFSKTQRQLKTGTEHDQNH